MVNREQSDFREREVERVKTATAVYEETAREPFLKHRDAIVPVSDIASIVADAELLHITTAETTYTINFRLKDLEARLDPNKFVRLSRGTVVNLEMISHVNPQPGGTYHVSLKNNRQLSVSRLQSRIFRRQYLRM